MNSVANSRQQEEGEARTGRSQKNVKSQRLGHINSRQQEEGEARTGMSQKDVKSRRRSVMDIFHDSLQNSSSSGGHFNCDSDYCPSNDDVMPESFSCGFSTHPDPMDDDAPTKGAEGQTSKPPNPANQRKDEAASANPWGLIFKNREHFVEIHLR